MNLKMLWLLLLLLSWAAGSVVEEGLREPKALAAARA